MCNYANKFIPRQISGNETILNQGLFVYSSVNDRCVCQVSRQFLYAFTLCTKILLLWNLYEELGISKKKLIQFGGQITKMPRIGYRESL